MSDIKARVRQGAITVACCALRPFFRAQRTGETFAPPRRILVFRRCCLGDTLMMTPLLAALDAAYPEATITYAVGRWSAAAVVNNPHIDAILRLPDHPSRRDWVRIVGKVRRGGFDLALIPERSPLPALAVALASVPRRVGLDSAVRGFALTDRVPVQGERHETDLALDLARELGLRADIRRPLYRPSEAASVHVATLLEARGVQEPLLVIHPGGGANPGTTMDMKRWPAERFAQVAATLRAQLGGSIILVGAESDRQLVNATNAALRGDAVDLCAALSLDELGALCARATLYIGNDSGTTHLAEGCGTPVVAIFGPTDPAQYGPTDGIGEAVWDPVSCGPYVQRGDLTRLTATETFRCIDTITVEQVVAAAERVLARAMTR
ncbi:MAG TPA: glycosyltransferase family 9 protein [Thermomicrobiales bacterium]|jgi:lipopolysaccharide heptosyltransferase II